MAKDEKKPDQVLIVEIDKNDGQALGTAKELNGAILGLSGQLGFQELLRRFRVARAILRTRLERPEEDENRHQLRALISAYGFLEQQLKLEAGKPIDSPREPYAEEQREYDRLSQFIQVVGRQTN